jgi:hypothetical protein
MVDDVEQALEVLLDSAVLPTRAEVRALVSPVQLEVPDLAPLEPVLTSYDALLTEVGA